MYKVYLNVVASKMRPREKKAVHKDLFVDFMLFK